MGLKKTSMAIKWQDEKRAGGRIVGVLLEASSGQ